jgi:hypothetical protein
VVDCVAVVGCVTVVSRVVVDVVVDAGSLAQELMKTATNSENSGTRSFFISNDAYIISSRLAGSADVTKL